MEVYVLTVINDDVLECIEIFDNLSESISEAEKLAYENNAHPGSRYVPQMDAWVIVDRKADENGTDSLFIAITLRHLDSKVEDKKPTHAELSQQIFTKPVIDLAPAVTNNLDQNKDNAFDPSLPGGFDYADKPITLDWIINHPIDAKPISSLSTAQKWALAIARISKRPNVVFDFAYSYDQSQALEHLKNKSAIGVQIRDQELHNLHNFISTLDSSWEDEEEYSSSSEDSEYF